MKKTIAILAVLVIALACVFAATEETHNIKLKTNVGVVDPIFQLKFKQGTNVGANQTSITNSSKAAFSAEDKTDDAADITVLDISKYDVTVVFEAWLANPAKINKTYVLSFASTGFAAKKNGEDHVTPITSTEVAAAGEKTGVESTGTTTVTSVFNGTTCEENGTLLATYTVVYTKDPTVDPHTSKDKFYETTVTMTVSAN